MHHYKQAITFINFCVVLYAAMNKCPIKKYEWIIICVEVALLSLN